MKFICNDIQVVLHGNDWYRWHLHWNVQIRSVFVKRSINLVYILHWIKFLIYRNLFEVYLQWYSVVLHGNDWYSWHLHWNVQIRSVFVKRSINLVRILCWIQIWDWSRKFEVSFNDFSYIPVELTEMGTITWNFHILSVLCHIKYDYVAYMIMNTFLENWEISLILICNDIWYFFIKITAIVTIAMKCSNSKCIC